MESETVVDLPESTSDTAILHQTEPQTNPTTTDNLKEATECLRSQDSVIDTKEDCVDVQERLSLKESLVLPSLDRLNTDLRASQDSLDKVADGENNPVVSTDPIHFVGTGTFIPIGTVDRNNEHESFYLNREDKQDLDLSDSGSYTDSLEPDDNIPHINLLPKRVTATSDQPESDQVVDPEADQVVPEVTETVVKRKRRRKSRLPVPKGMTNVKKAEASKEEKAPQNNTVSEDEVAEKIDNGTEKTKSEKETETKPIEDGVKSQNVQLANGTPVKDSENGDLSEETEKIITQLDKSEANGVGSDKSSGKHPHTCSQESHHAAVQAQGGQKSSSTPKCQRSQSIDEKGSGSKNSSRSSITRRETIDMGDTKPVCAARNLKETKMDLYMNSNEGLLIPHQQLTTPTGTPVLRDTIASRLRIEKAHNEHLEPEKSPLDYLTPFQRKEHAIKDLKRQMKNLNIRLDEKDSEIAQLREGLGKESRDLLSAKDDQLTKLRKQLNETESKYEELKRSYEESVKTVTNLEATVKDLKDSIAEQNRKNDGLYLEMYLKGQDAARYEREEEIEQMAGSVNDKVFKKTSTTPEVNTKELLAKLNRTQSELAKWQSLRREEAYQEVDRPETEAEATLRFLRDSFFHYITDNKAQDDHMRAMIQIFKFTDVQKKKITKSLLEKKTKKT
ncbi:hypothetical protein LOTGIDRAFT_171452 [Lottia gigantea]|uniref:GRIP domain-containing protein n=1 Tax=Lottia gigantea TaxID=225164 RepID=V4BBF2_LOTGI|nr:hypothetical protein LOTGIDRAFT_171452 [Lottia gigantea]ESP03367.1 hypothetical protein LOTGIDRAFT_171452 [Lottia gigantea]